MVTLVPASAPAPAPARVRVRLVETQRKWALNKRPARLYGHCSSEAFPITNQASFSLPRYLFSSALFGLAFVQRARRGAPVETPPRARCFTSEPVGLANP